MENFSDYTKLVIARMESNPEEFMHYGPKRRWETLVATLQDVARDPNATSSKILWALPKEEVKAMLETYRNIYLVSMYKHMLHQIVSGADFETGLNPTPKPQYEYDPNFQMFTGGTKFTDGRLQDRYLKHRNDSSNND